MSAVASPIITAGGIAPEILLAGIRGAHLDPCLLSSVSAPSHLARLTCPRVCLDFATLGPGLHFTGEMAEACYALVFVVTCPQKGRSLNFSRDYSDGYMGFYPPGGVLDIVTPAGYANATLTVPVAEFHTAIERHFPEAPAYLFRSGAGLRIGRNEQTRLRRLLRDLERTIWLSPESLVGVHARRQVERELLAVFLDALRSGCADLIPAPTVRASKRLRHLRQAREFLTAHLQEPIYLDDLCVALELSPRATENLFRDCLGMNPITYLRHRRLHSVRSALLRSEPGSGVIKRIALEWGFWHLGRFARDYRALFGESPSETLTTVQHGCSRGTPKR